MPINWDDFRAKLDSLIAEMKANPCNNRNFDVAQHNLERAKDQIKNFR
jgi:hypothetical protein